MARHKKKAKTSRGGARKVTSKAAAGPLLPDVLPNENQGNGKQNSPLLKLPTEIRYKIWSYAVKSDKPIIPIQVEPRSNKFNNIRLVRDKKFGTSVQKKQKPPVAAILSATCQQIYDEISSEGLFYRINQFKFTSPREMLVYLVAITPLRAQSIQSISLQGITWWSGGHDALIFMASACHALTHLHLTMDFIMFPGDLQKYDGLMTLPKQGLWALQFVRGLENLNLEFPEFQRVLSWPWFTPEMAAAKQQIVTKELSDLVTLPRPSPVSAKTVEAVKQSVQLNIFGDGRLGEDKKPGMIASRTRSALSRKLNDDGVFEEVPQPKFGNNGDLLWKLHQIKEMREIKEGPESGLVEVLCQWGCCNPDHNHPPDSWESLDRVINTDTWRPIADFYADQRTTREIDIAINSIQTFLEEGKNKKWALRDLRASRRRAEAKARHEALQALHEEQRSRRAAAEASKAEAKKGQKARSKKRKASALEEDTEDED